MPSVSSSLHGAALRLILSNATKRNPLSSAALQELEKGLKLTRSPEVRAVVISSEGPVFSAGHDLHELKSLSAVQQYELFSRFGKLMVSLRNLEVPVIASVTGLAAAAGCQLVAACDMAIAGPQARFSLPGASVGLFCSAPSVPVVRNINAKTAAYMLYSARPIDAQQALACGLVSHCAESDQQLEKLVTQLVKDIVDKPRDVITLGKRFLNDQRAIKAEEDRYELAARIMTDNLQLDNGREGLEAFVDKRHPLWK
ncbi:enoyl-CoA hydratase domain-containing protein 3, mitochondrial-like [Varroa jacobsoni]|uniref:Enoyl-CoA hydratase domain-containing protein 3, mitochondrial n=1 Tax=Varroa destructor TaxID=109461 RepID=A0A7M7KLP8_VARDE|nr:enoyl-CoA hydratase domain-containing protein 3, mitochondrial-like [Varroa destructor]XP_022668815.1 enoyl-CoA hydratase domain-containing protein 3, mitochondrial-like [Varroa destructor]XP_022687271.1 enoyl-CoA hydratase domain-containing protein 3, mitochondrial-like [Varroa jacobsoni]XP_022687272.1 enoyl-CoA hydratase domain-containing protein 3, mitochondrial-like [Varroa jacobsoni]XP_022687273.1 enoyl-CoA hydratase domain-containing protein 3, mitochondrial-like [Varroa jacobsoni]XP_